MGGIDEETAMAARAFNSEKISFPPWNGSEGGEEEEQKHLHKGPEKKATLSYQYT